MIHEIQKIDKLLYYMTVYYCMEMYVNALEKINFRQNYANKVHLL